MERKWWQDKIAYQIYPKSFNDTNGDGIGDLRGIIDKLDYLKELGVDIVWLSPIYCSPLADQGYDISDYYGIDPRFGTIDEVDELIAKAKERGMYIVMDLVVNHCSDEHEWFKKACQDPDGKYGRYFYIVDSKDGKAPTNIRSYFGGSAWEKLPGYENKYYLHCFHKKQPDLNWENPELREERYKMVNWWLDRGLGGFRVDAITNIKKALPFVDYPVDRPDNMATAGKMIMAAKGLDVFLNELNDRCFRPHDSFTVGEMFGVRKEQVTACIGENGFFSSIFDFATQIYGMSEKGWYDFKHIIPEYYIKETCDSQEIVGTDGFLSNIIENHDEPRGVSRYIPEEDLCLEAKKLLGVIQFTVRGIPFVFQGQEIGMESMEWQDISEIDDIQSIHEYEVAMKAGLSREETLKIIKDYSRDNGRTPRQWNSEDNAGFTSGKPWLKVNPNYREINVEAQINDSNSVLSFYKRLIAMKKNPEYKEILTYGDFVADRNTDSRIMSFSRNYEGRKIMTVANYQKKDVEYQLPGDVGKVIINNLDEINLDGSKLSLKGYQAVVLEII